MKFKKIIFWISVFCFFLAFVSDAGFLIPAFGWFVFGVILQKKENKQAECFEAIGKMFKRNFEEAQEHLKNGDKEAAKMTQERGKKLALSVRNIFQ